MKYFSCLIAILCFFNIVSCGTESKPKKYNVSVTVTPDSAGTISPSINGTYTEGGSVTLRANPNEAYLFEKWSGDVNSTENPLELTVDQNYSLTANFARKKYSLTVKTDGQGTVEEKVIKSPSADYKHGTVVELMAKPDKGWKFAKWEGDVTSSQNPVQVTVNEAKTVTAVFEKKSYALTVKISGEGTVSEKIIAANSTDYKYGTKIELTATPTRGWKFVKWKGAVKSSENPVAITIDEPKEVIAVFEKKSFKLSLNAKGSGSVTKKPNQGKYIYNSTVELTAKPAEHWKFVKWTGDISTAENPIRITMNGAKDITAVFEKKKFTLTVKTSGEGTVSEKVIAANSTDYKYGTIVELTAKSATGWKFIKWKGDTSSTENPLRLTVNAPKQVTAVFKKKSFKLFVTIQGNGSVTKDPDQAAYKYNSSVQLTAHANNGWIFVKWKGDITTTENPVQIKVTKQTEVTAVFDEAFSDHIYLTQNVQNLSRPVPLAAGRKASLFLFLKGQERNIISNEIRVKLLGKAFIKTIVIPAGTASVTAISSQVSIVNIPIAANFVKPGLSVLVKAQNGTTFPADGSPLPIKIKQVPEFHIRMIPIHVDTTGRTGNVNSNNKKKFLEELLDMYPVKNYNADVHAPLTVAVSPSSDDYFVSVLETIRALWLAEGRPDYYYYGVVPGPANGTAGIGYIGARQGVGWDRLRYPASATLAHEIGHNIGLLHTDCGGPANPDPDYPYFGASIGVYGYEEDENQLKHPDDYKSLMSYCEPSWISDYEYNIIFDHRMKVNSKQAFNKQPQEVLFVWGRIDENKLKLYPSFQLTAPPSLPVRPGPYTLSGYNVNGRQLFSISFAGKRIAHTDTRTFAFTLPVEHVNIKTLATLRLTGRNRVALQRTKAPARQRKANIKALPEVAAQKISIKSVSIQWNSSRYRMMLVKNARTGEVLGFLNRGVSSVKTNAAKLELHFSDGVHSISKVIKVR